MTFAEADDSEAQEAVRTALNGRYDSMQEAFNDADADKVGNSVSNWRWCGANVEILFRT